MFKVKAPYEPDSNRRTETAVSCYTTLAIKLVAVGAFISQDAALRHFMRLWIVLYQKMIAVCVFPLTPLSYREKECVSRKKRCEPVLFRLRPKKRYGSFPHFRRFLHPYKRARASPEKAKRTGHFLCVMAGIRDNGALPGQNAPGSVSSIIPDENGSQF